MTNANLAIELGDRVQDQVSGFIGIAIARTIWLNGCTRIAIQHETERHEGKPITSEWYDEQQVKIVDKHAVQVNALISPPSELPAPRRMTGGPQADPSYKR